MIGLEVHAELRTATKLFCGCRNSFGEEPNTSICPVCLGLPGSLPVLNRAAVEYAMRIGAALHCRIQASIFHRKNYFYPDMPKDYQISQYDIPINVDGWLELPGGRRIGIVRAHMEEDTGKTTHVGGGGRIHDAAHSLVDYNRAGVPLVEIVSAPDLRSAEEARAYVDELRAILVATGASDGKMEEGSLRVDANVSVRPAGSTELGTRCEIKNLNSLRSLGRAIDFEVGPPDRGARRGRAGSSRRPGTGTRPPAGPARCDPRKRRTTTATSPSRTWCRWSRPTEWIAAVAASIPRLPAARRAAVAAAAGLDAGAGRCRHGGPARARSVCRRSRGRRRRRRSGCAPPGQRGGRRHRVDSDHLTAERFVRLIAMEAGGDAHHGPGANGAQELLAAGGEPEAVAARLGFEAMGSRRSGTARRRGRSAAHPDGVGRASARARTS